MAERNAALFLQSEENKILNILFPRVGVEPVTVTRLWPCRLPYAWPHLSFYYIYIKLHL